MEFIAVKRIIITSVLKFLADSAADFDTEIWSNCYVALVKKPVHVAAQKEAVVNSVWSFEVKRLYMGGFKGWESVFFCDGTGAAVCIGNQDPKGALA